MITMNYAMRGEQLISINEVESGKKCNCTCPSCGSSLIARKGNIREHHFAHNQSEDCKKGLETALHLMAKEILSTEMRMRLPALYLRFNSYKEPELIYEEQLLQFSNVYIEKEMDGMIPDLVLEKNSHKLLVEIIVTHGINDVKKAKIEKQGISAISIDLSAIDRSLEKNELKEILLNDVGSKEWSYNRKERQLNERFRKKAKPFQISRSKKWIHCPQYLYGWKGAPSARWVDCIHCAYCYSIEGEVNCLGYAGVVTIQDLDIPELAEKAKRLSRENPIRTEWLQSTQCPSCRQGYLEKKDGK